MASIYKRKQDKKNRKAPWYIGYSDENGKRKTVKGFTEKRETERLAAKLEYDVMLRKRGVVDTEKINAAEQKKIPIGTHVDSFERHLRRNGENTEKHVKLTISRINKVIAKGKFEDLRDMSHEKVEIAISDLREAINLGPKTYNHYLQAMDSFGNWFYSTRRTESNPFRGIERMNTETDVRHKRRALKHKEMMALIKSARESGKSIQCYDGETRARIYILAYLTGLRRKELASLTPESFRLDQQNPTVTVEAACSKHRRMDVLPLHPELVVMLDVWLKDVESGTPLFPKLAKRRTWLMVKKDLEGAGIPYKNDDGIADFHAAGRHSHITELLRQGASLAEAKELARHSDVRMTMRYTHIGLEDQAKAVAKIGWECSGSAPRGKVGHLESSDGNEAEKSNPKTNQKASVKGTKRQKKTPPVKDGAEWRRRGSNPRPATFPRWPLRV